jgi:hypothetical protein
VEGREFSWANRYAHATVKDQESNIKIQGKSKLQNSNLARHPAIKAEAWILGEAFEVGALPVRGF